MLDILYCFDENYNKQAGSSISSLASKVGEKINLYIIHENPESFESIEKRLLTYGEINEIHMYKFEDKGYDFPNLQGSHVSQATYFRLFIENYLPNNIEYLTYIDADVIQADGGTRTASITGGMIALWDCVQHLIKSGDLKKNPIKEFLSAVSVGLVNGDVICDLCYEEDSNADVDMNIVMTESGRFVEIQGTAEKDPFSEEQFAEMLASAKGAISSTIQTIKSDILSIEN